ncbi:MAG: ATP-binding protein [Chloroflexota bacterium]
MTIQGQDSEPQYEIHLLRRLLDVSVTLNSNLDLDPLLISILKATCEITDSEAASILLYDQNTDELKFVASNSPGSRSEELAIIKVPMEGSIAGQIVRENRAMVIQNAADDSRIFRRVDDTISFQTRSLLGVPMSMKDNVIGVLESVNKRDGLWTEEDREYLSILAGQAAVAINNARQSSDLKKAFNDLSQLDKLKNDFIAIASHELRTPLGVILGYASFLQDEAEGEASEHAAAVLNSALHLRNLIEDMTNYLQLGASELIREDVRVTALLEAALHDVQSLTEAKGHHVQVVNRDAPAIVYVDRLKIGLALTNILNNAIKFTPNGGEIGFGVEMRPREVWIKISDNGMGIPEDQLEKIFEQFYQVADHMTRRHNGMGIGLSIAKGMVEAHDGRIWAESAGLNNGSTFYVALPLSED